MPQYFGQLPTNELPWSLIKAIKNYQQQDRHLYFACEQGCLKLSILAANVIRVRFTPATEFLPNRSWAVTLDDQQWEVTNFEVQETADGWEIKTTDLTLKLTRATGRLQCYDTRGRSFASDGGELGIGWRTGAVAAWKEINPEEHFYGFGERTGLLDKRSEIKTNWTIDSIDYDSLTDEMYQAIPFFMALRPELAYGIFFNTTYWSRFDVGVTEPGVLRMETRAPELDYYIIYGPKPERILTSYTLLTGRMPLPPRWSLGYHQSRWGYDSEDVVRTLAHEFRQREIPCDVIHLDIDYMRGFRVFTWSPKRFPHPKELLDKLQQDGFKVVTIVDPGVKYEPESDYEAFDEAIKQNYLIRKPDGQLFYGYVWPEKSVFPDFMRPEVRTWWGNSHKTLLEAGVAGIWNDMNEPSIADRPFGDKGNKITFPLDTQQGAKDEQATHSETHNIYGLMMVKASYEALQQQRPSQRSFVLTRSGYAGIQRYSAVWMGDNQANWEQLELSIPMLCNMGLSGVAFVGSDIGGFAGNATAELFARWVQLGILYPFMRAHSAMSTARREPWVFGAKIEDLCRKYIQLRYRLLPYLYTLFWQATQTGSPIFRPLLYNYPNDRKTYELHDQVFLGEGLMAAPVYRPGVEYRAVYLPEGVWYDWWTGERFNGPTHILAPAPLDIMPLYVKAGSIIPLYPVTQHIESEIPSQLTLRVFPGGGEFTLYEDDGDSFDYGEGNFSTTTYRVFGEQQYLVVEIAPRQGIYSVPQREVTVEVVGIGEQTFIDDGTHRRLSFPR